jgi:glucose-6-phosphate 1-dehydrogenase
VALDADAVRDEKVKVLRALRPLPPECVGRRVVRAQYTPAEAQDAPAAGYRQEQGVAPDSTTETFAALKLHIDNWRWAGVPFYLRTGKRLPARITEIGIHFKSVPQNLFDIAPRAAPQPNVLALRIQPNEGIALRFQVKTPGAAMHARPYQMDFGYAEAFGRQPPEAYERLLLDAALGDATLFTRRDEIESAWAFLTPILEGCRDQGALATYPAHTWGPREADELMEADGRQWTLLRRPRPGKHPRG